MWLVVLASLATMTAAMARGDIDEAARQGVLAGPAVVEQALGSTVRATVLAGVVAAPAVGDGAELLPALARVAGRGDRRVAIPAALAARAVARALVAHDLPDDLARADLEAWRVAWLALAMDPDRFIEVRVAALDVVAAIAPEDVPYAGALGGRDAAFRLAAAELVPQLVPATARAPLAAAVTADPDDRVALAAAQALCAELVSEPPAAALAALGATGLARVRVLAGEAAAPLGAARDAARCLAADSAAESQAVAAAVGRRMR